MKTKNIKIVVGCCLLLGVAVTLGWSAISYFSSSSIIDFNYGRDHRDIRAMFARDWDWLVPVGPDEYSLDLVLKYRAPRQDPLFAGRLTLKVLRLQEQMVGFVGYYMKNTEEGFLNFLDVNPAFRGKGYGATLARYAMNDMIERGARLITIVTYPHNTRALSLYTRLGFKEVKRGVQVELEYRVAS